MSTAPHPTNPHRAKALSYLRDGRVVVRAATWGDVGQHGSPRIFAIIHPATGDKSGRSVRCDVRYYDGWWNCDDHPGANSCAHRLAVQLVTGYGELGGRWKATAGHWADAPLTGLDLETTTTNPATARIVSAALVTVGPGGAIDRATWLADPGVPIPAEATAVHGISTEQARTAGAPIREVLQEVVRGLEASWAAGTPIVVMNAPYDLTVLGYELARYRMSPIAIGPVIDPMAIDWGCVPSRGEGQSRRRRRLSALADYYGVPAVDPHTADGDALTAVLVARAQAGQHEVLRQMDVVELQMWQAIAYRGWAVEYERRLRADGQPDAVIDRSWPVQNGGWA